MPEDTPLDNAIKAPEPVAAPPVEPAPVEIPDPDEVDEATFAEMDAKGVFDGKEQPPAPPAEEQPPAPDPGGDKPPEEKPAAPATPEPPVDDIAALRAEMDQLKQEAEMARRFQADPAGFLRDNPEQRQRIEQALQSVTQEQAQAQRPEWAYAPLEVLALPPDANSWGTYAGMRIVDIRAGVADGRFPAEHLSQIETALANQQGQARGRWEAEQGVQQRLNQQQQAAGWTEFTTSLKKNNPSMNEDAIRREARAVVEFMGKTPITPSLVHRLMNLDKTIGEAEARGEKRGREALLKEMEQSARAPGSAGASPASGASGGSLLDQYLAKKGPERADFLENLTDQQFSELEQQSAKAGKPL